VATSRLTAEPEDGVTVSVLTVPSPSSSNQNESSEKVPPPTFVKVEVSLLLSAMHGLPDVPSQLPLTILASSIVKPFSTYGVAAVASNVRDTVFAMLGSDAPTAPISPMANVHALSFGSSDGIVNMRRSCS